MGRRGSAAAGERAVTKPGTIRHITLATDLGARSDRAYDRACQLARESGAKLLAVHAVEAHQYDLWENDGPAWRRPDMIEVARRKLRLDYPGWADLKGETLVERGNPYRVVLDAVARSGTDLVVAGLAREETYGPSRIGDLVTELARSAPVPVLAVKRRVRGPYARILVATDMSEPAGKALQFARAAFAQAEITVFHAVEAAYGRPGASSPEVREAMRAEATATCRAWLAERLGEKAAGALRLVVDYGDPAPMIARYAGDKDIDLVVTGSHGRQGLADMILGSAARSMLERVPADVLVVRAG
jgi:nucleotide-binding universal stress UspA family protein